MSQQQISIRTRRPVKVKKYSDPNKGFGWLLAIAALALMVLFLLVLAWPTSAELRSKAEEAAKKKPAVDTGEDLKRAWLTSRKFCLASLKSPSTASFGSVWDGEVQGPHQTVRLGNRFETTGFVDAQNGFGAVIRNYWRCVLLLKGDGSFDLEALEMGEIPYEYSAESTHPPVRPQRSMPDDKYVFVSSKTLLLNLFDESERNRIQFGTELNGVSGDTRAFVTALGPKLYVEGWLLVGANPDKSKRQPWLLVWEKGSSGNWFIHRMELNGIQRKIPAELSAK